MNTAYLNSDIKEVQNEIAMNIVAFDNESYFKISNHDLMRPFLMSI